jgi:hypothetical protein
VWLVAIYYRLLAGVITDQSEGYGGEIKKVRLMVVSPLGFLVLHGPDVTCREERWRKIWLGGERVH